MTKEESFIAHERGKFGVKIDAQWFTRKPHRCAGLMKVI